jgi:hypothetical protein
MNTKNLGNCTTTSCPKIGIKIHESNNNYNSDPFNQINQINTDNNGLDLELDNYSLEDLYNLFNINESLSESTLKRAKRMVLKMHPDKSKLESKYFLFFSKAYKRLFSIYEFQNKSLNKTYKDEDFYDESNINVLDNMFNKNKDLKNTKHFNNWFNKQFEKHRLEDPNESGYGDWLKGDEGLYNIESNVTQTNMNEAFERQKKQIQSLTVYQGVTDSYASFGGTSLLDDQTDNFSGSGFTDLRQAHVETVIPICKEDYDNIPKYRNVNEYKAARDRTDITPISKSDAERILNKEQNDLEHQSTALAYKYAKEAERAKTNQQSFWGDIKQLTR